MGVRYGCRLPNVLCLDSVRQSNTTRLMMYSSHSPPMVGSRIIFSVGPKQGPSLA